MARYIYCGACKTMRSVDEYADDPRTRNTLQVECMYCTGELEEKPKKKAKRKTAKDFSANAIPSQKTLETFANHDKETAKAVNEAQ